MRTKSFIVFFILLLQGCALDCREIRNLFLPKEYYFEISKKKLHQYVILEGIDKNTGNLIQFKEGDYWGIYDSIQIGDTLLKQKGSTDIILKKPNRKDSLVFEMYCDGKPVSNYEQ